MEESQAGVETAFLQYGHPLETFMSFKYLGHILVANNYDWPAVLKNLLNSRKKWVQLS